MSDAQELPEWLTLEDDEELVWIGQPAFETLYGTIVTGAVLLVVVIGALILLGVPFSYLRIKNTDYVVTNKSLYVKRGILSTNIETVDLDRIQNTEFNQSFWGSQFGYGEILISTAGSSGAEITFKGIPDATTVRDRINELRNKRPARGDRGVGGSRGSDEPGEAGRGATGAQLEELIEEVRATRQAFERIERRIVQEAEGGRTEAKGTDHEPSDPEQSTEETRPSREFEFANGSEASDDGVVPESSDRGSETTDRSDRE